MATAPVGPLCSFHDDTSLAGVRLVPVFLMGLFLPHPALLEVVFALGYGGLDLPEGSSEYAHPCLGFFTDPLICGSLPPLGQLVKLLGEPGLLAAAAIEQGPEPLLHPLVCLPVLLYDSSDNLFKAEVAGPGS